MNIITILDVRNDYEFADYHVEDAINMPLRKIISKYNTLDKSTSYGVYCNQGQRSKSAYDFLLERGFNVINLGGFESYSKPVSFGDDIETS